MPWIAYSVKILVRILLPGGGPGLSHHLDAHYAEKYKNLDIASDARYSPHGNDGRMAILHVESTLVIR